jgi:hypothetical protein
MHVAELSTMKGDAAHVKKNGGVLPQSLIHHGKSCTSMLMMLRLWGTGRKKQGEQMQGSEICHSLAQWNHINQNYCKKRDPLA